MNEVHLASGGDEQDEHRLKYAYTVEGRPVHSIMDLH